MKKTQRSGTEFGRVHQIEAASKLSFGSILTQKLTPKVEIYAVVTGQRRAHWLLPAVLNWKVGNLRKTVEDGDVGKQ